MVCAHVVELKSNQEDHQADKKKLMTIQIHRSANRQEEAIAAGPAIRRAFGALANLYIEPRNVLTSSLQRGAR
jgi:hypothetical protein